jgi:hypothetical protein
MSGILSPGKVVFKNDKEINNWEDSHKQDRNKRKHQKLSFRQKKNDFSYLEMENMKSKEMGWTNKFKWMFFIKLY